MAVNVRKEHSHPSHQHEEVGCLVASRNAVETSKCDEVGEDLAAGIKQVILDYSIYDKNFLLPFEMG